MSGKRTVSNMLAQCRAATAVARFSAAAGSQALKPKAAEAAGEATRAASAAATSSAHGSPATLSELSDGQLLHLLTTGAISPHRLEADIGDAVRAVHLRRLHTVEALRNSSTRVAPDPAKAMGGLPVGAFDHAHFYKSILNTNCEAVIGYVPLPVGVVGPLVLDGKEYRVPLATTEGALVASTNRGCAAIRRAGGATTVIMGDGMTRAPLVRMPTMAEAAALKAWVEVPTNFDAVAAAFNSTSRFGRLQSVTAVTAGRNVYLRFKASTGDAMGMNMITKGCNEALQLLSKHFPSMRLLSLSGNFCTDKKPSAINWVTGRGKSVSAEVRLSGHVLKTVLKTSAEAMVELNTAKNLVGSALAGSVGGFNAHASNIVTALFLATGQDGAQNVESSNCLTLLEVDHTIADPADPEGKAGPGVVMSVTMPSIEVGTVGGGTSLPAQSACLDLLGLRGSSAARPGEHAQTLARVVAGSVLAGELSLLSALTTNDLLSSHMKLNRKHDAGGKGAGGGARPGSITPALAARLAELSVRTAAESLDVAAAASSSSHGDHHTSTSTTTTTSGSAGAHHPRGAAGSSYTTTYTAASLSPAAGHVPGGAPAGAHPHPLHLSSAGGAGGAAASLSPGRRYFAAPTHHHRHHHRAAPVPAAAAPAAAASWYAPATGGDAAAAHDDEPRLPVP